MEIIFHFEKIIVCFGVLEIITNPDNVVVTIMSTTMTLIATPVVVSVTVSVNHGEKPKNFNGLNLKRWEQKILFYLTTLGLARFLFEDPPTMKDDK